MVFGVYKNNRVQGTSKRRERLAFSTVHQTIVPIRKAHPKMIANAVNQKLKGLLEV